MDWRTVGHIQEQIKLMMRHPAEDTLKQRWSDDERDLAIQSVLMQWQRGVYIPRSRAITAEEKQAGEIVLPPWASHVIGGEVMSSGRRWVPMHNMHSFGTPLGLTLTLPLPFCNSSAEGRLTLGWYNPVFFPILPFTVYQHPDRVYQVETTGGELLPGTGYLYASQSLIYYGGASYDENADQWTLYDTEVGILGTDDAIEEGSVEGSWVIALEDESLWRHMDHSCAAYLHGLPLTNASAQSRDQHERQVVFNMEAAAQIWDTRGQPQAVRMRLGPQVF